MSASLLTVKEAAGFYSVHPSTVRHWVARRCIRAVEWRGREALYDEAELGHADRDARQALTFRRGSHTMRATTVVPQPGVPRLGRPGFVLSGGGMMTGDTPIAEASLTVLAPSGQQWVIVVRLLTDGSTASSAYPVDEPEAASA